MSQLLRTALAYASRGMAVFPVVPRDKRPAVHNGVKRATTNADEITGWWRSTPEFNIGLATGPRSGCFVVDVDGDDGDASLAELVRQHGALPATAASLTGRGSHLWFKWPDRNVRISAGKVAPGIDVRGDGGYVLAPPSIHPSGAIYAWSVDAPDTIAPAPQWLLDKITAPTFSEPAARPAGEWAELIGSGVGEGQRNDTIARLSGYLLRRHVDPLVTLELMLFAFNEARCRPPLEPDEVGPIILSIAKKERGKRGGFGR
jgi:hypothetical protein